MANPQDKVRAEAIRANEARRAERAKFLGTVQRAHGRGALTLMADHALDVPRFSFGVLELDLALGGGGPKGRIIELFGPEESGKTTLTARAFGNLQRACVNCSRRGKFEIMGTVKVKLPNGKTREVPNHVLVGCPCDNPKQFEGAWFDMEGAFDPVWFDKQGVWPEHCHLSRPVVLEEAHDVFQEVLESGQFDGIAFDSVAAGAPQEEMDKSAKDSTVGIAPRKWNSAIRKALTAQNRRYREIFDKDNLSEAEKQRAISSIPTVLLVNQIRMKIGVMFGNPETTPGGMGVPFAASVRVRCAGAATKEESTDDKRLTVHLMKFGVKKSRVSPKGAQGEYKLMQIATEFFDLGDIDQTAELVKYGLESKVIEGVPNEYYIDGVYEKGEDGKDRVVDLQKVRQRFRGKSQMELLFAKNKEDAQRVYDEIVFRMTGTRY